MSPWAWALCALRLATNFRGRARRREFWWYQTFLALFIVALASAGGSHHTRSGPQRAETHGIGWTTFLTAAVADGTVPTRTPFAV